jgi:polyisoprenoid-binding protein YceI
LGVTKPVTLDVVWNGFGAGMMPGTRTGFSATGSIKRTDFGFATYVPVIGDQVDLLIEIEFTKK